MNDAHVVTLAVTDGVEAVVEEPVLPREALDRVSAPVVLLAADVRLYDVTIRLVARRHVPRSAPLSARHDQLHASTTTRCRSLLLLVVIRNG